MKHKLIKLLNKLRFLNQWKPNVCKIDNLITIGTAYGGWTIPSDCLTESSICYLAGAGEDISFDVGIVNKYKCQTYIFDPTPRAKKHFDLLVEDIKNEKKTVSTNNNKQNYYNLTKGDLKRLRFIELGLWNNKSELKFFAPQNSDHVSHSLVNLQNTQDFFIAKVDRVSSIMQQLKHHELDLLKLDIEGAEYEVINSLIEDKLTPKVLCIEYDEVHSPLDIKYMVRVNDSIKKLINYGYILVNLDKNYNCTLILKECFPAFEKK